MSESVAVIEGLSRAFEEFKARQDERMAQLQKGIDDPLLKTQVENLNAELGKLVKQQEELALKMATTPQHGQKIGADQDFRLWMRRGVTPQARLNTQSDPDGGYLVPTEVETNVTRVLGMMSALRGLSSVRQISTSSYVKPINVGGATSSWVGEASTRSETSTPSLRELRFSTGELQSTLLATQTMLDDAAINVEQWLADEVAIEFSEEEASAFVTGNGVVKPQGILSYNPVANASYSWGNVGFITSGKADGFATSNPADKFIDLIHALKAGYRQGAAWVLNDLTLAEARKIKDGNGVYAWNPSMVTGVPSTLFGYPVYTDDNMPDIAANTYPIAFGDFRRGYLIVDRMGIRALRDPYSSKPYVSFSFTKRLGGGIQDFAAIKLLKIAA